MASAISGVITALALLGRTDTRTRASLLPIPNAPRDGTCNTVISTSSRRFPKRDRACSTASSTLLPLASILSTVRLPPFIVISLNNYYQSQLRDAFLFGILLLLRRRADALRRRVDDELLL